MGIFLKINPFYDVTETNGSLFFCCLKKSISGKNRKKFRFTSESESLLKLTINLTNSINFSRINV